MLLEFSLGPLWVWFFIGESPTWGTLWGGTIVIISVTVLAIFELSYKNNKLKYIILLVKNTNIKIIQVTKHKNNQFKLIRITIQQN